MITTDTPADYSAPNTDAPPPAYQLDDQVILAADDRKHAGDTGTVVATVWWAAMRDWLYELTFDGDPEPLRVVASRIVGVVLKVGTAELSLADSAVRVATVLPLTDAPARPAAALAQLPLGWIEPDPHNERADVTQGLEELQASMAERGLLEPIRVYKVGPQRFRLSSGHRRLAAAQALQWATIPAIIVTRPATADDETLDRLVANVQRADLTPLEEARGYAALAAAGWTQKEIGQAVGKSQPHVAKLVALLRQPQAIQDWVAAGTLTPAHVEELGRIQEPEVDTAGKQVHTAEEARLAMAARAAGQGWSTRSMEAQVKQFLDWQRTYRQWGKQNAARAAAPAAEGITQEGADARAVAEDARRVAREEQWAEERTRIAARRAVATQVVRAALDWEEGQPPTLAVWRVLGWYLVDRTLGLGSDRQAELRTTIAAAADAGDLLPLLAAFVVAQVAFNHEATSLYGWGDFYSTLEAHYHLNAPIQAALVAAGLLHAPEEEAAEEAAAEIPTHCPDCEVALVHAEGEIICPECEEVYGYVDADDDEADA